MYLGSWKIDDLLTFACNTHTFSTGAATDADSVPTYRIYEDETGTAILNGSMAKLDDANTTGFYSEQVTLSAANGFEKGKCYTVYISATVSSVTGTTQRNFQIEMEVDANTVSATNISSNVVQISGDSTAADNAEAFFDGTGYAGTNNVIPTVTTLTNKTGFSLSAAQTFDLTGNITGNLSGSVGSVTGNVGGNVAGSVASVTAEVTANMTKISGDATAADNLEAALDGTGGVTITAALTGNITGNLSGSVGSVTGNVGGSVASIAAGGISASSIAADAITAAKIADGAIDAATFAAGAINAAAIAADAITAAKIADGAIDAATFAASAINAAAIATGALTATKFAAGAIDAAALATDAVQEIRDAIVAATLTELTADPGASPELGKAINLIYMALRNKRDTTATNDEIHNNAGTVLLTATVSDDGTTFTKGKYA